MNKKSPTFHITGPNLCRFVISYLVLQNRRTHTKMGSPVNMLVAAKVSVLCCHPVRCFREASHSQHSTYRTIELPFPKSYTNSKSASIENLIDL